MDKKHSFTSSPANSAPPYLNTSISWGLPTESLSLKVHARPERLLNTKKISFHDHDSSSTLSTGQISSSAHSGVCRGFEDSSKANFSFHYANPHIPGLMPATYLPHAAIWNPQMVSRVPLPLDLIENEPVFVSAKQFHAIMRRREQRAKLEAQNKFIKARKPYLHESRHVHALKRPRGSGGRFLNTKKLQESTEPKEDTPIQQQHTKGNMPRFVAHQLHNSKDRGCSTTSGSDITSASEGVDLFQISECPSQTNPTMYVHGQSNDMHGGGNTHHFSVHI